jgi:hypothetical protein
VLEKKYSFFTKSEQKFNFVGLEFDTLPF